MTANATLQAQSSSPSSATHLMHLELDEQGIVLTANNAFLEMAGIVS